MYKNTKPRVRCVGRIGNKKIYQSKTTTTKDLLFYLSSNLFPKFFFQEKDSSIMHLAIGSLIRLSPEIALLENLNLRIYGAKRFDQKRDPIWEEYKKESFFIPQFEIIQTNETTTIYRNSFNYQQNDNSSLDLLLEECQSIKKTVVKKTQNFPDKGCWQRIVEEQKKRIKNKEIYKIVLSRRSTYTLSKSLSHKQIVSNLLKLPHSHIFAYILKEHKGFFGASPESLFTRDKDLLKTEAIAATRKRGKTVKEDQILEDDLKKNPKDLKEFSIVKNAIEACLKTFAKKIEIENLSVYKNPYIQHLHTKFKAKTNVDCNTLINALHPTPAIGGLPKNETIDLLRKLEPFSRGLYASVIGIKGKEKQIFAIAIRSFLVDHRTVYLYAGVGIVGESDPLKEWKELDLKERTILKGAGFESE